MQQHFVIRCIYCSAFLKSERDIQVFQIAHEQFMDGRWDFLILIIKEKIKIESYPADLQMYLSKFM